MHKHIVRLLTLIAVVAVVAISARTLARQDTFYQYGHYRGASVAQIAAKVPKLQGSASCQTCHKEIYAEWVSGMHRKATKDNVVQGVVIKGGPGCEVCHNVVAGNHPSKEPMPLSTEDQVTTITHTRKELHPANVAGRNLMRDPEDMRILCTNCHEKMQGRPLRGVVAGKPLPGAVGETEIGSLRGVPQVVIEGHGGAELCTTCHNPHSPTINLAAVPRAPVDPKTGKAIPVSAEKSGDAGAGKNVAAACSACHGNGMSVNPAWPNLAGQHANYLANSLKAFKSGARKNDMMSPMAAGLSDADIRNVAAYFSNASCGVTGGDKAKAELGKAKAAAAGCAACHSSGGLNKSGTAGISGSQSWPNLAGQNADYLAGSLNAFKDGSRNHAVMSSVAKTLSASDIDNLAAYFATASCK